MGTWEGLKESAPRGKMARDCSVGPIKNVAASFWVPRVCRRQPAREPNPPTACSGPGPQVKNGHYISNHVLKNSQRKVEYTTETVGDPAKPKIYPVWPFTEKACCMQIMVGKLGSRRGAHPPHFMPVSGRWCLGGVLVRECRCREATSLESRLSPLF